MKKDIKNNIYKFYYERAEREFGHTHFKLSDLYPLRKYKFGEIELYGAFDPTNYLNECYGKDWNIIAYKEFNHETEEHIEKIKIKITSKDKYAAQPTGPIIKKNIKSVKTFNTPFSIYTDHQFKQGQGIIEASSKTSIKSSSKTSLIKSSTKSLDVASTCKGDKSILKTMNNLDLFLTFEHSDHKIYF
jgi:hypothetical protein